VPRFKHFQGAGVELETAINRWLDDFEPDIAQMAQTVDSRGTLTISFVYDESFRGQELRLDNEHHMAGASIPVAPESVMPEDPVPLQSTRPERGPDPNTSST
jgi:hypothetical protein